MGNKPTTSANRTNSADLIREGPPPRESGCLTPELSNSGGVLSDPSGADGIDFSKNVLLKLRDSGLIGGKHIGGIAIKDIFENEQDKLTGHLPRGFPDSPNPEDLDVYGSTVREVTSIWPEYSNIRDIDVSSLKRPVRQTLQQILKKLSEQHELIRKLSSQNHDVKQELAELREERESNLQQLARRDRDIRNLREDVFLLRKELNKLGQEPKLSRQATARESRNIQDQLDGSNLGDNSPRDPKRLPLSDAEGNRPDSRKRVMRTPSLRPTQPGTAGFGYERSLHGDELERDESGLKSKLLRLEYTLEEERRKNDILRERLNSIKSEASNVSPMARLRGKHEVTQDVYTQRYQALEVSALDKVALCLSKQLSHTSKRRQQQFTCAVVQKSYDVALKRVRQFKDAIKTLINNPANPSAYTDGATCRPRGALAGQISLFEHFKPGYGINQMSPLAKKTEVAREIPEALTEEIYDFLESMADFTKISELIEGVVDSVRQEYGDCTTAALLNKAEFSGFLHDCCRFAWQVCVIRQPLYVTSTEYWYYDERYHVTEAESIPTNAGIDYYIFPILFSKEKSAEVLYKGRVCIKM